MTVETLAFDLAQRLEAIVVPKIPLEICPASLLLRQFFWGEWVDFLWRYKRRSPLLFSYMQYGSAGATGFDPKYLEGKVARAEALIAEARKDFEKSSTSFFWKCRILGPERRAKHWPARGYSKAAVVKTSGQQKEGIFFPNVTVLDVQQGLWVAMAAFPQQMKRRKNRLFVVDTEAPVGASSGKETSLVRYDVDFSACCAHAYPVLRTDVKEHPFTSLGRFGLYFKKRL